MTDLGVAFRENNISLLMDEPLKNWCTFNIGGFATIFVEPMNSREVSLIIKETTKTDIPLFVLGRGSNILFSDKGFRGVVMHFGAKMSKMELVDDNTIYCQSGALLKNLCKFALENKLSGMEELYGIPGSVGGAVYMNAGAYGREIKDVAFSATHVDLDGIEGELSKDQLNLSYRHSAYTDNNFIVTGLSVRLQKAAPEAINAKMNDYMNRRKEKQPLEYYSAGSTFKRPEGNYASALIDQCGLKGFAVGDAMVSEKHSGFVINKDTASFEDVMKVIEKVKEEVYNQRQIQLECEIKIID